MKVNLYMQLSKTHKEFNKQLLKGDNMCGLYASTIQPFETEDMDTIKITAEIPDRYFEVNTIATIPSKVEVIS